MLVTHQALGRNRTALVAKYGEREVMDAQFLAEAQLDHLTEGALSDSVLGANRPMNLNPVMRAALGEEAQHGPTDGARNAARIAIWGMVKPPSVPQLRLAIPPKQ
jgi:hypothetical protein